MITDKRRSVSCAAFVCHSGIRFPTDTAVLNRYSPLALPLGELSPKVTERAFPLSVLASLGHLSQWERQGVLALEQAQQIVPLCLLTVKCDPTTLPKAYV